MSNAHGKDKDKDKKEPLFKISLAAYSLHRTVAAKKLDYLDLAPFTKKQFGIDAVEHWNRPFFTKAEDKEYLAELKKRSDEAGVKSLLIMIDGEGNLGDPSAENLEKAVDRHKKWVEAAKFLGCHSIRVNARSRGSYDEQLNPAATGPSRPPDSPASPAPRNPRLLRPATPRIAQASSPSWVRMSRSPDLSATGSSSGSWIPPSSPPVQITTPVRTSRAL